MKSGKQGNNYTSESFYLTQTERYAQRLFEMFHPVAIRLISHCDAVLRMGGPSQGADDMVRIGQEQGKIIFRDLGEVPTFGFAK